MELRKHPKMTWQGRPTWPPTWNGPHGPNNPLPQGEVGVLQGVETGAASLLGTCCLLVMSYNDQDYVGTLLFQDEEFHKKLCAVLNGHVGSPISAIGSLDIP
jgi:hypothetical protein